MVEEVVYGWLGYFYLDGSIENMVLFGEYFYRIRGY